MKNIFKLLGINLATVGLLFLVVDNVLTALREDNEVKTYSFEMRHSTNISVQETPPKAYQNISNDNLYMQKITFETSADLGDVLPRGGKGNCKVFFYGGSTTEAHWVPETSRWVYLVGKKLSRKITAYNFGVGGYNGYQNFIKMHSFGLKEAPKIIVSMNQINDISKFIGSNFSSNFYYTEPGTLHGMYTFKSHEDRKLFTRLRTSLEKLLPYTTSSWRRYRNRTGGVAGTRTKESETSNNSSSFRERFSDIFIPRFASLVKGNADLLKARNSHLVVIIQPNRLPYVLENNENTRDVAHLKVQLRNAGLRLEDLAWAVEKSNKELQNISHENLTILKLSDNFLKNPDNFYDLIHYSKLGSERFAGEIFRNLKKSISNKQLCDQVADSLPR